MIWGFSHIFGNTQMDMFISQSQPEILQHPPRHWHHFGCLEEFDKNIVDFHAPKKLIVKTNRRRENSGRRQQQWFMKKKTQKQNILKRQVFWVFWCQDSKQVAFFGGMDRSHFQEVKQGNRLRGIWSLLIMRFINILYLDHMGSSWSSQEFRPYWVAKMVVCNLL